MSKFTMHAPLKSNCPVIFKEEGYANMQVYMQVCKYFVLPVVKHFPFAKILCEPFCVVHISCYDVPSFLSVHHTPSFAEPAPIATAWTTGLKEPSRGDRMILGAAKGKGGNAKPIGMIKLALPAGKATAAPPVGPALGQYGLNIVAFCKDYNARTEKEAAEGLHMI